MVHIFRTALCRFSNDSTLLVTTPASGLRTISKRECSAPMTTSPINSLEFSQTRAFPKDAQASVCVRGGASPGVTEHHTLPPIEEGACKPSTWAATSWIIRVPKSLFAQLACSPHQREPIDIVIEQSRNDGPRSARAGAKPAHPPRVLQKFLKRRRQTSRFNFKDCTWSQNGITLP